MQMEVQETLDAVDSQLNGENDVKVKTNTLLP